MYHSEMTEEQILRLYQEADGVWFYNYAVDQASPPPHAELTSGLCSDGYVNSTIVLADPEVTRIIARQLAIRLWRRAVEADWVIGSPYAAITLSYELARQIGARHGFAEKDSQDPRGKKLLWKRLALDRQAIVLQCEELITTLGTTNEVRRAVDEGNPERVIWVAPVATAVYRPEKFDDGQDIIALVRREVKAWKPEVCPLCAQGSKRLRPKQHWAELTGKK